MNEHVEVGDLLANADETVVNMIIGLHSVAVTNRGDLSMCSFVVVFHRYRPCDQGAHGSYWSSRSLWSDAGFKKL